MSELSKSKEEAWAARFSELNSQLPAIGTVISAIRDETVKIRCTMKSGEQPFLCAFGYVPKIVGEEPRWLGISDPERMNNGLRLIVSNASRNKLIRLHGIRPGQIYEAKSLKVVLHAKSGRAVIVDLV